MRTFVVLALLLPYQAAYAVNVPGDYPTISAALAAIPPGDAIDVEPGTWIDDLAIVQDVDIRAVSGARDTFLVGAGGPVAVTVSGGAIASLSGFTVDGNGAMGMTVTAATMTIDDSILTGGVSDGGGGGYLRATGSTLTVRRSEFVGNFGGGFVNGGHLASLSSTLLVEDSVFRGGTAAEGGAVYALTSAVTLTSVDFDGNLASSGRGGAVLADGAGDVAISGSWFFGNTAVNGGGLHINATTSASVIGSIFVANQAAFGGGAQITGVSLPMVDSSIFVGNTGTTSGGGILVSLSPDGVIQNSWFDSNASEALNGAGIYLETSDRAEVRGSTLYGNIAGMDGAGIYVNLCTDAVVDGNLICSNTSLGNDGGGMAVEFANNLQILNNIMVANAVFEDGGSINITDSTGVVVRNNDLLEGTITAVGGGGNLRARGATVAMTNNLVAYAGASGGVLQDSGAVITHDYNLFFSNVGGDLLGGLTPGLNDITGTDPLLTLYSVDGDCLNDDYRPGIGSLLLANGDPALPNSDGLFPSDIGAFGGPNGDLRWDEDADLDGDPASIDCDDGDAAINDATEWFLDGDGDGLGGPTSSIVCVPPGVDWGLTSADCDDADALVGLPVDWYQDGDGDGFGDPGVIQNGCAPVSGFIADNTDCDDANPIAFPGQIWYADGDGDGFGDPVTATLSCLPAGDVIIPGDCNDSNPALNPLTTFYEDADGDGLGNPLSVFVGCPPPFSGVLNNADCDDTDSGIGAQTTWYFDADLDGFGDPLISQLACFPPSGYLADGTDCDDADPNAFPGQTWYSDADGDGYGDPLTAVVSCLPAGPVLNPDDCDDSDPAINPLTTWYADADGDGFGELSSPFVGCVPPSAGVLDSTDCDDADPLVAAPSNWWVDFDGDGYGDALALPVLACPTPSGTVDNNLDCDDVDPGLNPSTVWYDDVDNDGFGGVVVNIQCLQPPLGILTGGDCDDADGAVSPGATEVCNTADDDCDGFTDDDDPSLDLGTASPWYFDGDLDTYGDPLNATQACAAPAGFVSDDQDCDDSDITINPTAPEQCDLLDHNCNGYLDDGVVDRTWYFDGDNDGFGDTYVTLVDCVIPPGYALLDGDCDDEDPGVNPGVDERCNGLDEDCDGLVDNDAVDALTYAIDNDGDGFGDPADVLDACSAPTGYVEDVRDCDDGNAAIFPGQIEICNGLDDDCNGMVDDGASDEQDWYPDTDGDGFGDDGQPSILTCTPPSGYGEGGDCDDIDPTSYPGADELCDSVDNDCDGTVDEDVGGQFWYPDADGDGFGDPAGAIDACVQPTGFVSDGTDCDDGDAELYPGAPGLDDSCNPDDDGREWDGEIPVEDAFKGPSGCDCDSAGPGGGALGFWLVFLAVARRGRPYPCEPVVGA